MARNKKIILVTGANGGIGKAILRILKKSNDYLYISHIKNQEGLKNLRKDGLIDDNYFICDFSNISEIKNKLSDFNTNIDILINNVGVYDAQSIFEYSIEDIIDQLTVNFISNLIMTHNFLTQMRKNRYGRIINISSGSGNHGGLLPSLPYAISKNAINYMTDILPKEIDKFNIKINTFIPRFIDTPMLKVLKDKYLKITTKKFKTNLRIYQPEEIAQIIMNHIVKDDLINGEKIELI